MAAKKGFRRDTSAPVPLVIITPPTRERAFELDRVVSEAETAKIIGYSKDTLRREFRAGRAPARVRLSGRRIGYRLSAIYAFLERTPRTRVRRHELPYAELDPQPCSRAAFGENAGDFQSRGATMTAQQREQLPNRRLGETFELEVAGLYYTATIGRFPDGRLAEIFLSNYKSNSAADTNARDSAIVCSIALQCGADLETIRKALCRDSRGRPSGPLSAALDLLAQSDQRTS
jgi:predicted DNA-binding transcriptional regulator AlpA